jgi:cytidyltransferase-like protein
MGSHMSKIICTSGYFNPLHIGHLKLLEESKKLGDYLVVIVNNDEQVKLKGSKVFMNQEERMEIVKAIRYVDKVILSIDTDRTVIKTLSRLNPDLFVKGGDSTENNVPEKELGIKVLLGVGGDKIQSSSWLKK